MDALTFFDHADSHALLKAAELASVASPLVHRAVLVAQAHVFSMFLNCSLQNESKIHREHLFARLKFSSHYVYTIHLNPMQQYTCI